MSVTDPVVVLTYGPSGVGKTVDNGFSFPRALFMAAPGALNSIQTTCGYTPERVPVLDIATATQILGKVAKKYDTVVIDDFSFMAEQSFAKLEGKFNGFTLWGELRNLVLELRDASRNSGVNVILNAWEQGPKKNAKGERVRGGPKLSGNLPEAMPAMCDVVLRAVHNAGRQPWPVVYQCSADPGWVLKDRFNVVPLLQNAPMNLGEILRAAGLSLPRHPDYPGQEEQVEQIARTFTGDPSQDAEQANTIFKALREKGQTHKQAYWTLRDAMDRAVIRAGLEAAQNTFISNPNPGLLV